MKTSFRLALLAGLALLTAAGCSKGGNTRAATPDECLKAFDAAMRAGEFDKAAGLFAYDKIGEQTNPDWSGFAASQRQLIIGKMHEQEVQTLRGFQATYVRGGYQLQAATVQGDQASADLAGARDTLPVKLFSHNGNWLLVSVGSLPAPTPGS